MSIRHSSSYWSNMEEYDARALSLVQRFMEEDLEILCFPLPQKLRQALRGNNSLFFPKKLCQVLKNSIPCASGEGAGRFIQVDKSTSWNKNFQFYCQAGSFPITSKPSIHKLKNLRKI